MDVEKGAAGGSSSSEDETEEVGGQQVVDLECPQSFKGMAVNSAMAGAHLASLPYKVRRRVKALKKLQMAATDLEAKFFEEVYALECKYHKLHAPLYTQRAAITDAKHEPSEEESAFPLADTDSEDEDRITEINEDGSKKEDKDLDLVKGIPSFWLTIFQTEEMLVEVIGENDEELLEHLWDISLDMDEPGNMGFKLSFHFHPNSYFTDAVLTKRYSMKCTPDKADPFGFEGPEIYKCEGCKINWKEGKNVTVKQVKKKVKKGKDKGKTVTKEVKAESFFRFFSPPALPEDPEAEVDEDIQMYLQQDFQIGHFLRERVVPRAVLFYTGEEQEDDEFDDEEDEDDDDEEGDSEDEDDEEVVSRPKLKAKKGKGAGAEGDAPECKQQ